MSDRKSMRLAWDIPNDSKVALIIYENETEWSFRTYLLEIAANYDRLFVFPVGPSARKHLNLTCGGVLNYIHAVVVDTLDVEVMADDIILFRVNEELMADRKANIRIVDPQNRWLTRELS